MDRHLRNLQRQAQAGDLESTQRYIAALERIINDDVDVRVLRALVTKASDALSPFARLEDEIDEGEEYAVWDLDNHIIIEAARAHRRLKRFLESGS
jgi:hypothetical protein